MIASKWERGNLRADYKLVAVRLNLEKDADIIAVLNRVENASGYIKDLIRNDLRGMEE